MPQIAAKRNGGVASYNAASEGVPGLSILLPEEVLKELLLDDLDRSE